jgi:hypothetical protein
MMSLMVTLDVGHFRPRVFAWVASVVNGVHLRLAEMLCYDSGESLQGKTKYVNNLLLCYKTTHYWKYEDEVTAAKIYFHTVTAKWLNDTDCKWYKLVKFHWKFNYKFDNS